jgi:hypothetical protein
LEYTLARTTKLIHQSVEAALGRCGLPATIEESNKVITDLGDLVTVQTNHSHAFVVMDARIGFGEVLTALDGLIHLCFDESGHLFELVCLVCTYCSGLRRLG